MEIWLEKERAIEEESLLSEANCSGGDTARK
jgi:hypothetical protein